MTQAIFDAHFHIIDPDYPLIENHGYQPEAFRVADYRQQTAGLNISGGAVVSGSFQGFDQDYLIATLAELGPGFVGVTNLPLDVSDAEIVRLDDHNIRAVRFNLFRMGEVDADSLKKLALRVYELAGWHVELYADAATLEPFKTTLARLPAVSIDHLGLSAEGLPLLLELVQSDVRVKASGFGRVDFDVSDALKRLYDANMEALMFGTDLPSTRAPRPFQTADIELIESVLGADGAAQVLHANAARFYRVEV